MRITYDSHGRRIYHPSYNWSQRAQVVIDDAITDKIADGYHPKDEEVCPLYDVWSWVEGRLRRQA